jgi:hypothetical protein
VPFHYNPSPAPAENPCEGKTQKLGYNKKLSLVGRFPGRSSFQAWPSIVEKILPRVEFFFYFLRMKGREFASKINEIEGLWR